MTNILRSEIYKLLRNKAILVTLFFMIVLSGLLHYLIIIDWWMITNPLYESLGLADFKGMSMFYVPLALSFFLSFIASTLVTTEFKRNGVIKNQVISGAGRGKMIIAKGIVLGTLSVLSAVIIPLVVNVILVNFLHGISLREGIFELLVKNFLLLSLADCAYSMILLFIATISKDTGRAIIYSIIFTLVMFAVGVRGGVLYDNSVFGTFDTLGKIQLSNGEIIHSILVSSGTILVMILVTIFAFNKSEIY